MTKLKYMHCQQHFQASGLCLSQLLASVQYLLCSECQVCSSTAVDVRALGPSSSSNIPYQCMHCSTMCLCCVCCSIEWDSCPQGQQFLVFPPLNPNCRVSFAGSISASCHFSIGQASWCSSTSGCDCSCSSWAPWAPSLHLGCGYELDIKLFIYLCGIF